MYSDYKFCSTIGGQPNSIFITIVMFTAARRCVSNALARMSITRGSNGSNINIIAGCYIRKLTRTANGSGGGLKAAVTTALLFIMGALYCLYGIGGNTSSSITSVSFGQQSSLGVYILYFL